MAEGKKSYRFERAARADLRNGVFWYQEKREGLGGRFAADVPGNVRELRNAVERAAVMCTDSVILPKHLPPALLAAARAVLPRRTLVSRLKEMGLTRRHAPDGETE